MQAHPGLASCPGLVVYVTAMNRNCQADTIVLIRDSPAPALSLFLSFSPVLPERTPSRSLIERPDLLSPALRWFFRRLIGREKHRNLTRRLPVSRYNDAKRIERCFSSGRENPGRNESLCLTGTAREDHRHCTSDDHLREEWLIAADDNPMAIS